MTGALTVRELRGRTELALTPPLARAVWGEDDGPEDPVLLQVVQRVGGLVAGAVDPQGQVWAYLVGLPTARADTQHSHRLGVHPAVRRQGLGERLKRFQQAWCLEREITRVTWTFDPLLLANAHLNIHRLGAVAVAYLPNYYGEMGGINAGVPSDRFEVVWPLGGAQVHAPWPTGAAVDPLADDLPVDLPGALAVRVPRDYYRLLREDPALALEWRQRSAPLFSRLFQAGHTLVDVDLSRGQYLFRREAAC
ncbi:GNAT family N-acetyltransferase [Deinococcus ficus]|uniref:GNAT family N-acetyltransferase n=1 Tax=Deinococcus ficus TaxID=317577 RepID=A0A221T049_9DEIO|nr:GNAT family N-acetyltransferase [Deinococcus ficus]ASN82288.1 GNAT family N-acetyltransferase [Deinococcus ficus]